MATVNLGKIAFTWKGAYSSGATYYKQDVVSLNGDSWVCLVDGTMAVNPGTDATKWSLFAQGSANLGSGNGSLIYHNGSQLASLPVGTAGQVLKVSTSTGLPVWGSMETRSGVRVKTLAKPNISYRRIMVIMEDDTVRGWGNNSANSASMLGNGNNLSSRAYPNRAAFPVGFVGAKDIYLSHNTVTRVIDKNGQLWCWGNNDQGSIGTGDVVHRHVPYNASANLSNSISSKTITQIAQMHGAEHYPSCVALASDGTVHSCGYGLYGQLGNGGTASTSLFAQISGLSNITKIAAGRERYTTYYAVSSAGALFTWGYNNEYQLGNGTTTQANTPSSHTFFTSNSIVVTDVVTSLLGAHVLSSTGNLYYFGTPSYGQGGTGATTAQTTPVLVATGVRSVWASQGDFPSVFIIKTDNTVWAAGANAYGQLGTGNTTQMPSFTQINGLPSNVTKIVIGGSASYGFTAFMTADGKVYTTGYNASGQLGLGDATNRSSATLVPIANRTVVDIAAYGASTEAGLIFELDDGQLLVSGAGNDAVTGDPNGYANYSPTPIIF